MRCESALTMFCAALCCGLTAPACAQSVGLRDITFELTSLTASDLPLQHGILNYITLSMQEVGTGKRISIKEVPPFPLLATLRYRDRAGAAREAVFECDYRC
jgi:hypothetical protein